MKKKDLKETLKREIESEATALERRVNTKKSLASLEMPEDSYEDLMERMKAKENTEPQPESDTKPSVKRIPFHAKAQRRALATAAMVAVLVAGAGLGVKGARLYMLNVGNRGQNERVDITVDTDNIFYVDLTEEEAYKKIEEELGILALRLTDRPKGMELQEVFIDAELGEALMEFYYDNHILEIYENKQNRNVTFYAQQDGVIVDTIEVFHLGETLDIAEIDKGNGELSYTVQLEYGNAFYYLSSDMRLEELESILYGIIFKSV